MLRQQKKLLNDALFGCFALFVFGSTFSIALAQIALGASLFLFIIITVAIKYNPFTCELRWFYLSMGLYILWMIIASLMGDTPSASIFILKEEWLFCAVPVGIYLLSRDGYRSKLITAFATGAGLFALYGLLQFFTGVHWFKSVTPNPGPEIGYVIKGNFPSPMTFGNYFGTVAGFFGGYILAGWSNFKKGHRILFSVAALVSLLATIGSYNRGAILGVVIGSVILGAVLKKRKMLISIGVLLVAIIVLVVSFPGPRERFYNHTLKELDSTYEGGRVFIWNNSLKIAAENPVFGVGQGNFRDAYLEYLRDDIPDIRKRVHAHNDFLNVAAVAGIPGALFFVGIWIAVFCYLRRQLRSVRQDDPHSAEGSSNTTGIPILTASLIGSVVFLVSSLTEATFADEEVRQMLMFVWAVGLFSLYPRPGKSSGTIGPPVGKTS